MTYYSSAGVLLLHLSRKWSWNPLALETQYHFHTLIQDHILSLLSNRFVEASIYEEEETEGDEQLQVTLDFHQQLKDHLKAIDIYSKAKHI